jgi:hypothetical protein
MFNNSWRRHGKARKGNRAVVNRLRLWRRGLHESMTELGRAGRWENWWGWGLSIVFIMTETLMIGRVAGRNRYQAMLVLTLKWGAQGAVREIACIVRGVERHRKIRRGIL